MLKLTFARLAALSTIVVLCVTASVSATTRGAVITGPASRTRRPCRLATTSPGSGRASSPRRKPDGRSRR